MHNHIFTVKSFVHVCQFVGVIKQWLNNSLAVVQQLNMNTPFNFLMAKKFMSGNFKKYEKCFQLADIRFCKLNVLRIKSNEFH